MKLSLLLLLPSFIYFAQAQTLSPEFLGSDTLVCDSAYALLKAEPGYTYLWSTDDTTQTIKAYESGSYWVKIMDPSGNSYTDTIDVTIKNEKYKRADTWYFGNGAGIKFDSITREPYENNHPDNFQFAGGSSALSDYEGRLQLYTNGASLYSKDHQLLADSLAGDSTENQNSIIIPKPKSNRYVYTFTMKDGALSYSVLDMFLDNGRGKVIEKNTLLHSGLDSKLTSVKTGDDVWLIAHQKNSNTFVSFKITPDGAPFISVPSTAGSITNDEGGFLKADPNGTKVAMSGSHAEIFDFDNTTGIISNPVPIIIPGAYGIEFSQDGGQLFVSTFDSTRTDSSTVLAGGSVFKVDLGSSSIDTLYRTDPLNPLNIGALQLGPDNKIYVAKGDSCLSVIDPAEAGTAAFSKNGICLNIRTSNFSLPSFPQHFFKPPSGPGFTGESACLGSVINFAGSNPWEDKSYIQLTFEYDFGDGSPRAFTKDAQHLYTQPGSYTVTCIITANSCKSDTVTQQVMVFPNPNLNHIKDSTVCAGETISMNAQNPGASYSWSTGETTNSISISEAGIYSLTVNYGPCGVTKNFRVDHRQRPPLNLGADKSACTGETITLDAVATNVSYQWSSGENSKTIQAANPGSYWLRIFDGECTSSDTVNVVYYPKPASVNFSSNIVSCKNKELLDAGNPGYTYLWSTGQTSQTIEVIQNGNYWVEISKSGCKARFQTNITFQRESANIVGNLFLCEKDNEKQTLDAGTGTSFLWSTGEATQQIEVILPGKYYVTKTFSNNCQASDTVYIQSDCKPIIKIPNAFTPNLDGDNDAFKPIAKRIKNYELKIFNRWGEIIFVSNDLETGWDGSYKGIPVQPGAYVYTIAYEGEETGEKENLQGHVTVFR